jgi:hypothetical protein
MSAKKEAKKRGRPAKVVEPVVELPETPLKAVILGACNNPTWMRGRIDGFAVNVKVSAQMSKRLIGKEVMLSLSIQTLATTTNTYHESSSRNRR